MEIVDYLSVARRRIWILVLIPLVAVVATAGFELLSARTYSATATVSTQALVGGPNSTFAGTQGASQFVAAFSATATGPATLAAASRESGVPAHTLASGLTVSQKGLSSNMSVQFDSTNKSAIAPALKAVVAATLKNMFNSQVSLAANQVADAQKALATTNHALVVLGRNYGADPRISYQTEYNLLQTLLKRLSLAQAAGKTVPAANLDATIAQVRAKLAQFAIIIPRYAQLTAAQQAEVGNLSSLQGSYRAAVAQLKVADAPSSVFLGPVHSVSRAGALLRALVPVLALSIILAVGAVTILELLGSTRRSSRVTRRPVTEPAEVADARTSE
jgi:capsular polysaccharide biosynthesis protein